MGRFTLYARPSVSSQSDLIWNKQNSFTENFSDTMHSHTTLYETNTEPVNSYQFVGKHTSYIYTHKLFVHNIYWLQFKPLKW